VATISGSDAKKGFSGKNKISSMVMEKMESKVTKQVAFKLID
jgi:hypothetical protein